MQQKTIKTTMEELEKAVEAAEQHRTENRQSEKKTPSIRKWVLIVSGCLLIALFMAFLTCPKKADHIDTVSDTFKRYLLENKTYGRDLGLLGSSFMSSILSYAIQTQMDVKDRWVYSIGKFNDGVISVGLFGHVWVVVSQEDFDRILENPVIDDKD